MNRNLMADTTLRLSCASIDKQTNYVETRTPNELEGGALRCGTPPVYTSYEVLAVLLQYGCVGLFYGCLPNLNYPVFTGYYHMTGAQSNSVKTLLGLGWTFKVFFGLLTDCVPLLGYRRKPWMIIGWLCCLVVLIVVVAMDFGKPYYSDLSLLGIPLNNMTESQLQTINTDAPDKGGVLAILFGIATVFYVITDSAADGLVIEYAQREPLAIRGRMQSLVYATRTVFSSVSMALVGFCMNSPRFAGSFDWDFGLNTMYILLCIPCIIMPIIAFVFINDTKQPKSHFPTYISQVWQLIQKRATWQIMLFSFFYQLFASGGLASTAAPYVMMEWAEVKNLNYQVLSILSTWVLATMMTLIGKYGTQWNWKVVVVTTILSVATIDAVVQFCTIFNVLRSQYFYLGAPLAEAFPNGIAFIVTTFLIAELAGIGNEGMMCGLFMTTFNLPQVVGPVIGNIIYSHFTVDAESLAQDSESTRYQVAYTYIIYYGAMLLGCCTVVLLPSQKEELQQLQLTSKDHPYIAGCVCVFLVGMFVIAVLGSLLAMFPSTSCLRIAGGSGC
ncbi:folate-Biopterin Transporter (FBT) family [Thraustotheca clavata]|uniref:Folate-Biopterin Transporter (FBT) family n=1 Tax=Thraustotheca clavata TaxID=74557 RepID=A0A1V9ZYP5_9STRA|nr:folate-Biopterin Transporter (FBT) family [Thraustotheca clavata]